MVNLKRHNGLFVLATLLLLLFMPLSAQFGDMPKPDVRLELNPSQQQLLVHLEVPSNHHITDIKYGFFGVKLADNPFFSLGEIEYPSGEPFGDETIFRGSVVLKIPLLTREAWTPPVEIKLTVSWQMCQESPVEMCFAPDELIRSLTIAETFSSQAKPESVSPGLETDEGGFVDRMMGRFQAQLASRSFLAFLSAFLLGFLTSLTPCVYPVIPVIMGFVGARSKGSKARGFSLSVFFVIGLALVYSLLGVIAAQTGSVIGASFQNPAFVIIIALVFVAMGLSMAGLFDIPVPSAIASKAHSGSKRNQWLGAIVIGAVSGFIAAPCAGPVVIALITFISQTSDLILGFGLMFSFALGMGMIFLLVGTFSGLVGALPQGGGWMEKIKLFFAILMIGAGIYFIGVVTPVWLSTVLWGVFLIGFAMMAGALDAMPEGLPGRFGRLVLIIILLLGAFLFFDGLREWRHGDADVLSAGQEPMGLNWLKDADAALGLAREQGKVVMVDAFAEWCSACKELDHKTFSNPEVQGILKNMVLLKLDLTDNNENTKALRRRFSILAMPTVIFMAADQTELSRFTGFKDPAAFLQLVKKIGL